MKHPVTTQVKENVASVEFSLYGITDGFVPILFSCAIILPQRKRS